MSTRPDAAQSRQQGVVIGRLSIAQTGAAILKNALMTWTKYPITWTKYPIIPVPKPRQTQRDKWDKRPPVLRYRAFADEVRMRQVTLRNGSGLVFVLPMPKSWSEKKKAQMDGRWHEQKPDLSNLIKALEDACFCNDSHLAYYSHLEKLWGYEGEIWVR